MTYTVSSGTLNPTQLNSAVSELLILYLVIFGVTRGEIKCIYIQCVSKKTPPTFLAVT